MKAKTNRIGIAGDVLSVAGVQEMPAWRLLALVSYVAAYYFYLTGGISHGGGKNDIYYEEIVKKVVGHYGDKSREEVSQRRLDVDVLDTLPPPLITFVSPEVFEKITKLP